MRLGALTLQNRPWPELVESWRTLDALGLESLWVADHLANPLRPERPWLDGWTVPARRSRQPPQRARVGALVSSMTLRNPAVLAKAAVTLDHVSEGRAELALGAGGSPRDARARRTGPCIRSTDVRRAASSSCSPTSRCSPRPVQERIPLTIGGHGDDGARAGGAVRRTAGTATAARASSRKRRFGAAASATSG